MPNSAFTEWEMVAKLLPSDDGTTKAPSFGGYVSIDSTLIAVGSPDEGLSKGSVYIFEHTGPLGQGNNAWVEAAKLSPDDVADGSQFGSSVSLFGDDPATLVVGAPRDAGGGSAFVYRRSDFDWLPQKLAPRDIQEGDNRLTLTALGAGQPLSFSELELLSGPVAMASARVDVIPEPLTLLSLSAALGALAGYARRRRAA